MADDKGAPDEEMIEKPREPMFSKSGWLVLFGSNIIIGALIVVVIFVLGSGGGEKAPDDTLGAAANAVDVMNTDDVFLKIDGNVAYVVSSGTEKVKVSFTFLISFDAEDQAAANTHWSTGERGEALKTQAEKTMEDFSLEEIKDGTFKSRYESKLKARLNSIFGGKFKVRSIMLRTPNIPN